MSDVSVAVALLGTTVLLLSLGAEVLRSRPFLPSDLMLATALGVAVGPLGLGLLELSRLGEPLTVLEHLARLTVAIAVVSIALRLPPRYLLDRATSLAVLLGPGMLAMWLASSAVTYLAVGTSLATALLVGAVVTPTDPVVAGSIVTGHTAEEHVPEPLRNLIAGEAAANDALAYGFVFLAIGVATAVDGLPGLADVSRIGRGLAGALAIGLLAGAATGWAENELSDRELLDETSIFTVAIALTFAVVGIATVLDTADVLAAFVAGIAYNWTADPGDEAREQSVEEVFNQLFTLPVFVAFGAAIPWAEWTSLGWRAFALVVGVLLLRRLPMLLALQRWIEPVDRPAATLFVGWFGPIGVAALLYATLAVHETGARTPWVLASLVVAGSILAHGATATTATHWYPE